MPITASAYTKLAYTQPAYAKPFYFVRGSLNDVFVRAPFDHDHGGRTQHYEHAFVELG